MTVIVEDTVIRFGRVIEVYKPRIFLFAPVNDFSKHFILFYSLFCIYLLFDVKPYFTSVNVWNASSAFPHVQDPKFSRICSLHAIIAAFNFSIKQGSFL